MKGKLYKESEGYYLLVSNKTIGTTRPLLNFDIIEYKLSLENCQTVERGWDLDELARDSSREYFIKPIESPIFTFGYEEGFQKALELMGDKKFSEGQLREAFFHVQNEPTFDVFIQSLQQTEWDVEVEMEKVKDETKIVGSVKGIKGSGHKITTYKSVPKLDADGCLILKKI